MDIALKDPDCITRNKFLIMQSALGIAKYSNANPLGVLANKLDVKVGIPIVIAGADIYLRNEKAELIVVEENSASVKAIIFMITTKHANFKSKIFKVMTL